MRAKTLPQALNIFDPERPLKTERNCRLFGEECP
jgi:hypothetical protein